ncbi:MAG: hypothetical protein AAFP67_01700 [Pseudomonadota bacterium]
MAKLGSASGIFGILLIGVGLFVAAEGAPAIYDGMRLETEGAPVSARIDAKRFEPRLGSGGPRLQSVSVNGVEARSIRTYLRLHTFDVSYSADGETRKATAPVSFDQWRDGRMGDEISVRALPDGGAFVDLAPFATFLHGLKKLGIGALICVVGLVSLRLPD